MLRKETPNPKRKVLKMVSRTWMAIGALAVCYALTITNCAPVANANGAAKINFALTDDARSVARLTHARELWQAESGANGDPYTAGFAAYEIASVTHDAKWATEAIARLGEAQAKMPDFALATAWRGSAHALAARDFPLQGAWQFVPGPGLVRIYHVQRAEALLNAAVAQAPNDPAVRLIRAATLQNMPAIFVDQAVVDADFALMARWNADATLNADFAEVLTAAKWRTDFAKAYADHQAANDTAEYESSAATLTSPQIQEKAVS